MILFDGVIHVHYGFASLGAEGTEIRDLLGARGGQANGLCGAAMPEALSLITGLHTGRVPIVVELLEAPPTAVGDWEDVVEVSFEPDSAALRLQTFDEGYGLVLPALGSYRAKYCASGLDAAHEQSTRMDENPPLDRYLLQLWQAPPSPDIVLRQTSEYAAYWHGVARDTPAPPSQEERRAAKLAAATAKAARRESLRAGFGNRRRLQMRGGVEPTPQLAAMGSHAMAVARHDRPLATAIAALTPSGQRQLANWVARQACDRAPTDRLNWGSALDALDRGAALPPPFNDRRDVWRAAFAGPRTAIASVPSPIRSSGAQSSIGSPPPDRQPISSVAAAVGAVLGASEREPGPAAMHAIAQASAGYSDPTQLLDQVRTWIAKAKDLA